MTRSHDVTRRRRRIVTFINKYIHKSKLSTLLKLIKLIKRPKQSPLCSDAILVYDAMLCDGTIQYLNNLCITRVENTKEKESIARIVRVLHASPASWDPILTPSAKT